MNKAQAVSDRIRTQFEAFLKAPLSSDAGLLDKGLIDSLGTMQLIMAIEEEFKVRIPTEEFTYENFNSLSSWTNLVLKAMAKRDGAV
jgi:acyl carrier protein